MNSKTLVDDIKEQSKNMTEWGANIKKFSKLKIDDNVKSKLLQEF